MSQVQTERVLVVPTEVFHSIGHFQGFSDESQRYLDGLLRAEHLSFRARAEVEEDPSYKQLIPYVIFRYTDPSNGEMVFQYTRGTGQGEGRLHRKRSVGIGGHISAEDAAECSGTDAYEIGLQRELSEEVAIETAYNAKCVGLINDDDTEVGRVHLGVVHIYDVEQPSVSPLETDIAEAGFEHIDALLANREHFETWSQICLEALFG